MTQCNCDDGRVSSDQAITGRAFGFTCNSTGIISSADMWLIVSGAVVAGIAGSSGSVADVNSTCEQCISDVHWSCVHSQGHKASKKTDESDELHGDYFLMKGLRLDS